ncbi:MAG: hypothetical protein RIF32_14260 [Leptospirales bacterium]|jgi:hypothetical protein
MQNHSDPLKLRLKAAVIEAYRGELSRRYSEENVRRFPELAAIPVDTILRLRDFFLKYIYPTPESRGVRDSSFDEMGNVLKSPRKLWPLFGTAVSSIWKLGGHIGAAIQAGLRTLEAYIESKRLEQTMIDIALAEGIAPEDFKNRDTVAGTVRLIPKKKVVRFQKDMLLLFESLANVELLKSSLGILRDSRKIMAGRPKTYSERELAGLDFGLELLQGGYDLFQSLSAAEVEVVLLGIDRIEKDWYQKIFDAGSD